LKLTKVHTGLLHEISGHHGHGRRLIKNQADERKYLRIDLLLASPVLLLAYFPYFEIEIEGGL
jgi:hypothetical protein